jgi:putative nucleotide binding protein
LSSDNRQRKVKENAIPSSSRQYPPKVYEEYAYVLDILPYGRAASERAKHMAVPTVQVIGENFFTLLEAQLKPGASANIREKIYVGRERREKVDRVIGRVGNEELTAGAQAELQSVIEDIARNQEKQFVDFFNKAQAVTPRMHALELLPGIGKKLMWQIINQREKKPFESFADIKERTGITDPARLIARRVIEELSGESKYRLFTRTAQ